MSTFAPKVMSCTRRLSVIFGFLILFYLSAGAQEAGNAALNDSDSVPFVVSSLLVITPGPNVYSVFGHAALRMECPSKHLDYCFTFETQGGLLGYLRFFAGQSKAAFLPVPTDTFLTAYRQEGRGIRQYELNLTPHEKQELWRALDDDMLQGAHRKFNLLQNNCTSMAVGKIESILDAEYLDFGRMPEQMYYQNGRGISWLSRRSPWGQFLFMTFVGSEADDDWQLEAKISPELVIPVLKNTLIRKSNSLQTARPALTGAEKTLLPLRTIYEPSPLTPNIFFAIVLALVVLATVLLILRPQWWRSRVVRIVGWAMDVVYVAAAAFLLYVTIVAGLFGVHWNWLIIPINLIPLIIWLVCRRRWRYRRVYLFYSAALVLFLCVVPWITSQLLLSHYLLVASIAVASAGKGISSIIHKGSTTTGADPCAGPRAKSQLQPKHPRPSVMSVADGATAGAVPCAGPQAMTQPLSIIQNSKFKNLNSRSAGPQPMTQPLPQHPCPSVMSVADKTPTADNNNKSNIDKGRHKARPLQWGGNKCRVQCRLEALRETKP